MLLPVNIFFTLFIGFAFIMLLRTIWIATRLDSYLRTSKKGQRSIEEFGYDKSLKLMKTVAIPIGIIAPVFFIAAGIAMYKFIANTIASGQI